jgi:hypothetical protein
MLARVYRGKGMIKLHRGGMATQIGLFLVNFANLRGEKARTECMT